MIKKLLAVTAIGLFAVASNQAMAVEKTTIGNARTVVKTVIGSLDSERRNIQLLDDIYHIEVIETGDESATESDTGSFGLTATAGVFRFVSGKLPKNAYEIHTPTATIGIRGTVFSFIVIAGSPEGAAKVVVTVEEGVAEITSCLGETVSLVPGASTTVSMNSDGTCAAPTDPGA